MVAVHTLHVDVYFTYYSTIRRVALALEAPWLGFELRGVSTGPQFPAKFEGTIFTTVAG